MRQRLCRADVLASARTVPRRTRWCAGSGFHPTPPPAPAAWSGQYCSRAAARSRVEPKLVWVNEAQTIQHARMLRSRSRSFMIRAHMRRALPVNFATSSAATSTLWALKKKLISGVRHASHLPWRPASMAACTYRRHPVLQASRRTSIVLRERYIRPRACGSLRAWQHGIRDSGRVLRGSRQTSAAFTSRIRRLAGLRLPCRSAKPNRNVFLEDVVTAPPHRR